MVEQTSFRKKMQSEKVFDYFNVFLMSLLVFSTLYPFWYILIVSLSEQDVSGIALFPKSITLGAYQLLVQYKQLWIGYKNTILRCIIGTSLSVFFTAMTAYPLSKRHLPFCSAITNFFLLTMIFNGGLIPTYMQIKALNLIDSFWALIFPCLLTAFNIFVMRNFFRSIPEALEESARIDGASYFTIWLTIIVPLSKAVIATIALWTFVSHWNAWFDALIYIRTPAKTVLQTTLRRIAIENNQEDMKNIIKAVGTSTKYTGKSLQAAMVVVTIIPMLIIYPFIQKYFAKGIMIGSVKG